MAIPKILGAQRDFSYGEVDIDLKRSDEHPAFKNGLRQCSNIRLLKSKKPQNRPGRRALYPLSGAVVRTERITMSPGNIFDIQFGAALVQIVNSAGTVVFTSAVQGNGGALPWTSVTADNVVFAVLGLNITMTFAGMRPQVISWDGVSVWVIADYQELLVGTQKRTAFYRISPQGSAIQPSAQGPQGASVTVTLSGTNRFTAAWVGCRIRYVGRQLLVTAFNSPTQLQCTVEETLPGTQTLTFATSIANTFQLGDVVIGGTSGSKGYIVNVNTGANQITVQLLTEGVSAETIFSNDPGVPLGSPLAFVNSETVGGPGGGIVTSAVSVIGAPSLVPMWDDEVMNALNGYPASCFVDQFRLGFTNFPSVPGAIAWSAINSPTDLYVTAGPANALFEIAPDKVQIYYVVPGPESSEFVFCDHKVYYIKVDAVTPLEPGSVSFQTLTGDGAAQVQPRVSQDVIFYVKAGAKSVMAVVAPGAYYRPFNTKNVSLYASHLFKPGIVALAAPNADGTFVERYLYALNADGSMAVGRYEVNDGVIAEDMGWGPWSGVGAVSWIGANFADVIFTSKYFGTGILEILDDTQLLDAGLPVNALPAAFTPPGGKGPLWWIPSQSVTLIDQGNRMMGTYQIDANGFIIPQFNGGENLSLASLVAGQPWTAVIEPFVPDANPGTSVHQRMFKRRISRMAVAVENSTGLLLARLFSGPITPTSPALGTIMNTRRIPAWNQGDNPLLPPPLREDVERWRPLGRAYDPRVAIIKDTPGTLLIPEITLEVSI
jgi:hypothetical protein